MLVTSTIGRVPPLMEDAEATPTAEIEQRWMDRLAGVDVLAEDHVRTALIYVRWDD